MKKEMTLQDDQAAPPAQQRSPGAVKLTTIRELLAKRKDVIQQALPRHITPERLMRVAMTSIQTTPALLECTEASLIMSIIKAAEMGLEVGGGLGHAYLVPFWKGKGADRHREAQLIPGYQGLIELARRSGSVADIYAHVVYEKDTFDLEYGLQQRLVHKPAYPDRGNPVGAYCVAKIKDSDPHFEFMSAKEINGIRSRSQAKDNGPWVTDTMEMWRKTVTRRTLKYVPKSIEVAALMEVDNEQYAIGDYIDVEPVEERLGTDGLRARLEARKEPEAEEDPQPPATPDAKAEPKKTREKPLPGRSTTGQAIEKQFHQAGDDTAIKTAWAAWSSADEAKKLTEDDNLAIQVAMEQAKERISAGGAA
jgi:recombination protein RecT